MKKLGMKLDSLKFQFHKGTIKTQMASILVREGCSYFNSIKVRLKPNLAGENSAVLGFQFHKGTIKTASNLGAHSLNYDFNSIKVRLKQMFCSFGRSSFSLFQFHKGTIKTVSETK